MRNPQPPPSQPDPFATKSSSGNSILKLSGLRFRYRSGSEELFDGIHHTFAPHAISALTGTSGRGKSTLLYILGLMLTPTSGDVRIDHVIASDLPDHRRSALRASRIGFVFQDSELDPSRNLIDSIIEPGLYAGTPLPVLKHRAYSLLEKFSLAERATHKPGQISGGQAQRVAVCRALVNRPSVVLADEPTGNLDPDNATLVLDALSTAVQEGCTVVIATHDPTVVARTDEALRL